MADEPNKVGKVNLPIGGEQTYIKQDDTDPSVNKDSDIVVDPIKDDDQSIVTDPVKDDSNDDLVVTDPVKDDELKDNAIIINDEEYTLDDKGNALKDGQVVYTAEDIQTAKEESERIKVLEEVSKLSGIEILDETGVPKQFDLTPDGLAERDIAIKNIGKQEGWNEGFNTFLSENPDIAKVVKYKQRYGTIEGYKDYVDYKDYKLDPNNLSDVESIVYEAEIKRGRIPEKAKQYIEYCKANNSLVDEGKDSLDYLVKTQTAEEQTIIQLRKEQEYKELQEEASYLGVMFQQDGKITPVDSPNSVYDLVVEKGQLGDLIIPKEGLKIKTKDGLKLYTRKDLFNYLAIPVTEIDGMPVTQAQYDIYMKTKSPKDFAKTCLLNLCGGEESFIKANIEHEKVMQVKKINIKSKTQTGSKPTKETNKKPTVINWPIGGAQPIKK